MIRKDYILRMVEEFAKFLSAIVGLKREGKFDEALRKIDEAYKKLFDLDPIVLKSVDSSELLDFLQTEKGYSNNYLKMVAEMLFEEGQIYDNTGDPISARNVLEKSKMLINHVMENDATFSFDWYEKLSVIDSILNR